MPLRLICPGCQRSYQVPEAAAGRHVRCPAGHVLAVPEMDLSLTVPDEPVHAAPPRQGGLGLALVLLGLLILVSLGACLFSLFGEWAAQVQAQQQAISGSAAKTSAPPESPETEPASPKPPPPADPNQEVTAAKVKLPDPSTKPPTNADKKTEEPKLMAGMLDRLDRDKLDFRSSTPGPGDRPPPVWDGHTNHVRRVAFTSDGQFVISVSGDLDKLDRPADNSIRVWDARTGKQVHKLEGFPEALQALTISPGGRYALFSHGGRWETVEGRRKYLPAKSHGVFLWDIQSKKVLDLGAELGKSCPDQETAGPRFVGLNEEAFCTDFSPCPPGAVPASVIAADRNGGLALWKTNPAELVFRRKVVRVQGYYNSIRQVKFTPDGRHFVLACSDFTLRIHRADTGEPIGEPLKNHEDLIWGLDVARGPDGAVRILSGGGDHQKRDKTGFEPGANDFAIRLWDFDRKEVIRRFEGHTKRVYGVAFCPDGRHFVSCGTDRTVRLWDLETGKQVCVLGRHDGRVRTVAVSPDGRSCVSGGLDCKVRFWQIPAE